MTELFRGVLSLTGLRQLLLVGSAVFLSVTLFLCLLRAVLGPRLTDRVIAVNIVGTKVIVLIAILSLILDETYLADICLIYAVISFLSVVVLSRSILSGEDRGENLGGEEAES
ncbi:MAG: sodium:proton antiporter [Fretibacterium sp.]|nr:sodium:proton antiporter [Fretibacterium sp.]